MLAAALSMAAVLAAAPSKGPAQARAEPRALAEVRALMTRDIPGVRSGKIVIRSIHRRPGLLTKAVLDSPDPNYDYIAGAVGEKGALIRKVVAGLKGERIDLVPFSPKPEEQFNLAIQPVQVTKLRIDPEGRWLAAIIVDADAERALAKKGAQLELAAEIIGWDVDLILESDWRRLGEKAMPLAQIQKGRLVVPPRPAVAPGSTAPQHRK